MTFTVTLKVVLMSFGDPDAEPCYLKDLVTIESLEKAVNSIEGRKKTSISTGLPWRSVNSGKVRQTGKRNNTSELFRHAHLHTASLFVHILSWCNFKEIYSIRNAL